MNDSLVNIITTKTDHVFFSKVTSLKQYLIDSYPDLLLALAFLMIFYIISVFTKKGLEKLFTKSFHSTTTAQLLSSIAKTIVIIIGVFFAMSALGLDKAIVSLLAGAGILGVAFGFAFQDLAQNLLAGFILGMKKPFRLGHYVEVAGKQGYARHVGLRTLTIETREGGVLTIPNKSVLQNIITNFYALGVRRIDLKVGVRYTDDLERVTKLIVETLKAQEFVNTTKKVQALALEFGESSINFSVRFWIAFPGSVGFREAQHLAVIAIKKAFDQNGIVIPFPIRTLEMDFPENLKISG